MRCKEVCLIALYVPSRSGDQAQAYITFIFRRQQTSVLEFNTMVPEQMTA
jgi:hypothetical protein